MDSVVIVQGRVLGALILRETRTAFGNSQLGYFWAIFQPAAATFLLVLLFSQISRTPSLGESFALFFGTGMFTYQLYNKLSHSVMTSINSGKGLLTYPLVKETDLVLAKYTFVTMTYLLINLVFFTGLISTGEAFFPKRLEVVGQAFLTTSLLGLAAGITNAALFRLWSTWKNVETIISRPMLFLSGVFYIPSDFPPEVSYALSWNPVIHCVEWMRQGYYGYYQSQILDLGYLYGVILALLLFGFGAERLYRKKRQG